MAIKNIFIAVRISGIKKKFFIFIFFFIFSAVFAQDEIIYSDAESAVTDETESGITGEFINPPAQQFFQRLSWRGGEYALRYEVEIQRYQDESYSSFLTESTEDQFIEVSMPPGEYRFRVIPFDVLNRPSQESEWAYIQVLRYREEESEPEFESDIARFEFDFEDQEPEPEPEINLELLRFREVMDSFDVKIGFAWKPVLLLYGTNSMTPYLLGFEAYLGIFPENQIMNIIMGMDLTLIWYYNETTKNPNYYLGVNFILMKWFAQDRLALSLKTGVLFPAAAGHSIPALNIGSLFHWRINNRLILEAGAEYQHILNEGLIYPRAGFAITF